MLLRSPADQYKKSGTYIIELNYSELNTLATFASHWIEGTEHLYNDMQAQNIADLIIGSI